jgi:hypothetical protein
MSVLLMAESSEFLVMMGGRRLPADFPVECRWLTDCLAIGSMIGTLRNMRRLRDLGVTHVLCLQAEFDDRAIVGDSGIDVIYLPFPNHSRKLPLRLLREAMERASGLLAEAGAKLFVHCLAGHHRAPTVAYAVLRRLGWTPREAAARILATDPRAQLAAKDLQLIDRLAAGAGRTG